MKFSVKKVGYSVLAIGSAIIIYQFIDQKMEIPDQQIKNEVQDQKRQKYKAMLRALSNNESKSTSLSQPSECPHLKNK